jgi:subtilisin family serine protease
MRLNRGMLVFLGASLLLGGLAWSLWPSLNSSSASAPQTVHFKVRAGAAPIGSLGQAGVIAPLFPRSAQLLAADRKEAVALGAKDAPDLSTWFRMDEVTDPDALVRELLGRADIVDAFVAPTPELALMDESDLDVAGDSCPITTPTYDEKQVYLSAAPAGIDVAAAWALPGGRGTNVAFADIEGAWNDRHEDLPGERMYDVGREQINQRSWVAHGTAVVGVLSSKDNELGMVGIAPEISSIVVASIGGIGPAAAIDQAQAALEEGDVLLIELHSKGPRRRFLPMEYWGDVFDVVKLATGRGIVVVAAAGNGGEDLNHKAYKRKFDRNFRDSGAILVGAGAPSHAGFTDRSRLDFSNYGSRVDVQGWGRKVATLDYGDLQDCGSPHRRKYTAEFAGTSSASPIVTGAAILLQSIYKERHQRVMSPTTMRDLLRKTGSPQTDGPSGSAKKTPIGPRPDLKAALAELP